MTFGNEFIQYYYSYTYIAVTHFFDKITNTAGITGVTGI